MLKPGASEQENGSNSNEDEKLPPAEGEKPEEGKEGEGEKPGEGEEEISIDDAKKLIKKLRGEAAKGRLKNKDLETKLGGAKKALIEAGVISDDSADPEEQIKGLSAKANSLQVDNAILSMCVEHGVLKDEMKYFRFLVNDALDSLGEDEELDEDRIAELAQEARGRRGGAKSTSVSGKGKTKDGTPPPEGNKDGVTYEEFRQMSVIQKSELYRKNKDLAERYMNEARKKGHLIGNK